MTLGTLAGALALSYPAVEPLLASRLLRTHDWGFHASRASSFIDALRGGELYPRWLAEFGLGHGMPVFNYYPALAYYPIAAIHALGLDFVRSFNLATALALVLSGLTFLTFAYHITRSWSAALAGSVIYVYYPYHLVDAHERGALAETWTFVWLPLVLSAALLTVQSATRWPAAWLGLTLAALLCTHILTGLLFLPALIAFLLWLIVWLRRRDSRRWPVLPAAWAVLGLGLGLALSAFYWLPLALERHFTRIGDSRAPGIGLSATVEPVETLLAWGSFNYVYGGPGHPVGMVPVLIFGGAVLGLIVKWPTGPRRALAIFFAVYSLAIFFTLTVPGRTFWEALPVLSFAEFPFRNQTFLGLGIAGLAVLALASLGRVARLIVAPLVAAVAILTATANLQPSYTDVSGPGFNRLELQRWHYVARSPKGPETEFLPKWAGPDFFFLGPDTPITITPTGDPALDAVQVVHWQPTRLHLTASVHQPTVLRLHTFYFPGWQATVDGRAVDVYPSTERGLVTLSVPPGDHNLVIWFGDTPVRAVARWLSLLALTVVGLVWLGPVLVRRPAPALALVAVAVAVGALGLSKAAQSQEMSVVDRPVAPGLQLLGTRLEYQSPSRLIAHLLWFNQAEQRSPVALTLRLLSPDGAPRAELTEFPFYGFEPPSLWTANEIVTDVHLLNLPAALSPGDYTLEVGLADSSESIRVPVRLGRPTQPDPYTSAIVHPSDVTFGGQIQLTGHGLETLTRQPLRLSELAEPLDCRRAVLPGSLVRLQLDWSAVARPRADYTVFTHLENQAGDRVFGQDMQPERDLAPTSSWLPGRSIRERRIWRLPNNLAPGLHSIRVGLYQPSATGEIVPLPVDGGGPSMILDRLKVGPTPARPAVPRLSGQRFGDALTLLGYDPLAPKPEGLEVPLFWRAEQPPAVAYTGFVHVVDAAGRLVAQQDQPIGLGQSPTDCWAAGEEVADRVVVRFGEPLPMGRYTVYVGVYDPATLTRLPLQGSPGDVHALFTFELP